MTELVFSEELQNQIDSMTGSSAPENTESSAIRFDAKGTVHARRYADGGKLVQDIPLYERASSEAKMTSAIREEDIKTELNQMSMRSRRSNIMFWLIIIMLTAATIACFGVLSILGGIYGG